MSLQKQAETKLLPKPKPEYGSITSLLKNEAVFPAASSENISIPIVKSKEDSSTFFNDGSRKVDFVLVYQEQSGVGSKPDSGGNQSQNEDGSQENKKSTVAAAAHAFKKLSSKQQKIEGWRQKFLSGLQSAGLEMEDEFADQGKHCLHFVKLHAPWSVISNTAMDLNFRGPIQIQPNPRTNWSSKLLAAMCLPNIMEQNVPNTPPDFYTAPFRVEKFDKFLGSENKASFFTRAQRSRFVFEILSTIVFGREKKGEVGIDRLIGEGAFSAAYPLHDGSFEWPGDDVPKTELNSRQILFEYWARWSRWYKYQPLDHIRDYFGEKIAIYFAWLGFYTGWLLPAAIIGLAVFLYGIITLDQNSIATEVCGDQIGNLSMCPLCEKCTAWKLHNICSYTRIAYLFDNPGTVFYAVFMSFWAVTFLEYWKRKNASLAHQWDCMGFTEEDEKPRPQFAANAPYLEKNPITGIREPAFPSQVRLRRIAAGSGLILVMISLVLIFILAVIIYRTVAAIWLFNDPKTRKYAPVLASTSGAMINLMFIMAMGRIYEKLAVKLTNWGKRCFQIKLIVRYYFRNAQDTI